MSKPQKRVQWTKQQKIIGSIAAGLFIIVAIAVSAGGGKQAPGDAGTKPHDTSSLNATIQLATDVPGIEVTNNEDVAWDNCVIKLNDSYSRTLDFSLKAHTTFNNSYSSLVKSDGTRFNGVATQPKSVFIACNVNGDRRSNYYAF